MGPYLTPRLELFTLDYLANREEAPHPVTRHGHDRLAVPRRRALGGPPAAGARGAAGGGGELAGPEGGDAGSEHGSGLVCAGPARAQDTNDGSERAKGTHRRTSTPALVPASVDGEASLVGTHPQRHLNLILPSKCSSPICKQS